MDRRRTGRLAVLVVLALIATSCATGGSPSTTQSSPSTSSVSEDPGTTVPASDSDLGLAGCAERPLTCNSGPRQDGGELVFLINQNWEAYNNYRTSGGSIYTLQALAGMVVPTGVFAPDGSWQWNMDLFETEPEIVQLDPLTIEYRIRDEAVWYDSRRGTTYPITADDFILEWYNMSGKEEHCVGCAPRATQRFEDIVSIEGSDDGKIVIVTFPESYAFAEWFALFGPFVYPAAIAEAEGFDLSDPGDVGLAADFFERTAPYWSGGPYVIETAELNERIVMVPNPEWYGEIEVTLDTLVKEKLSDQGSWLPALANRDIHGGSPASFQLDMLQQLDAMPDVHYTVGSGGAVWEHIDVNMEHPSLSDRVLRHAIFTAIDRENARDRIWAEAAPPLRNNFVFPQAQASYYEDHMSGTGFGSGDIDGARQLLADAGYTGMEDGPGALTRPDGEPVGPISVFWVEGNANRATLAELIQADLAQIGIEVTLSADPNLNARLGSGEFDLAIFGWVGSPTFVDSPAQLYRSDSESNFGRLDNPEIDELASRIQIQADLDDAALLANEVDRLIMDEAYSLPLWDIPLLIFLGEELVNIRDNYFQNVRAYYETASWGFLAN